MTYRRGILALNELRQTYTMTDVWPVPLEDICKFTAYLFQTNLSHSFFSRVNDFEDPTQKFVIKKMLEGIKRSKPKTRDTRLPITKELLVLILRILPFVCVSQYERKLFSAAFSVAYHGLLRVGEIAFNVIHSRHVIAISNVSVSGNGLLNISIPSSKTDQIVMGTLISLQAQINKDVCPCNLMRSFLTERPLIPGPVFCHCDGRPLTRYQFVSVLKKVLERVGVEHKHYSSHLFRIGCATSLSILGLSDDVIMKLGR
jgi:hypothetical protein